MLPAAPGSRVYVTKEVLNVTDKIITPEVAKLQGKARVDAIWTKLGDRAPSAPVKFSLGAMIMGVAFLLFLPWANGAPNSTPLMAIVMILFVFTIAELFISPPGLSVTTKLAPERFHTQMVALYFLSIALGIAIAGWLAQFYNPEDEVPYFTILGGIAIVLGLALLASVKPVLRMMRGVR